MQSRRSFGRQMVAAGLAAAPLIAQQGVPPSSAPGGSFPPPASGMRGMNPEGAPIPGQKWKVHDATRPQPRRVTPGLPIVSAPPPSDAIILFDGRDFSKWTAAGPRGAAAGEPRWKVENGYMETVPRGGSIATKEKFGDCQLHLEWTTLPPADPEMKGQMRGNSGVILMGHYEVQVLSSYDNPTYADGMAGAIYGLYPPMVNPARPDGEWNSYDIVFEAPQFDGSTVVKPAYLTLIFNGVLVHHRAQLLGNTAVLPLAQYRPHAPEEPLVLQGHAGVVRYRNIWIRRLRGYDV